MTLLPARSLLKVTARAWQFAGPSAAATFLIVWMLISPIESFGAIVIILVLSTIFAQLGMIPVILLLTLYAVLLRRFAPGVLALPLPAATTFMIGGAGAALGEAFLVFGRLGTESEFLQVVMLAGAVGGVVAGWIMSGQIVNQKKK